jgi:hypothetical protein
MEQREEFRKFLVDAHKAAYIPICLAGSDTDSFFTTEPALVVPLPSDPDFPKELELEEEEESPAGPEPSPRDVEAAPTFFPSSSKQRGVTLRRTANLVRGLMKLQKIDSQSLLEDYHPARDDLQGSNISYMTASNEEKDD